MILTVVKDSKLACARNGKHAPSANTRNGVAPTRLACMPRTATTDTRSHCVELLRYDAYRVSRRLRESKAPGCSAVR